MEKTNKIEFPDWLWKTLVGLLSFCLLTVFNSLSDSIKDNEDEIKELRQEKANTTSVDNKFREWKEEQRQQNQGIMGELKYIRGRVDALSSETKKGGVK